MKSINPCHIVEENNSYSLEANPNTDFICKYEAYIKDSAALYYQTQDGDFTIKAKLTSKGSTAFDAAFLMVRQDSAKWIKLAVELGVDKKYNVVSVITNKWSDDANGELLEGNSCWLRITRKKDFFGLHYSLDGNLWRFVRAFGMKMAKSTFIGFGIQAPKGDSCSAIVEEWAVTNIPIENFRDGN
ncbi:MAG: DUF1349 domain-containing protein [Leeuwenhoekiella sp.]